MHYVLNFYNNLYGYTPYVYFESDMEYSDLVISIPWKLQTGRVKAIMVTGKAFDGVNGHPPIFKFQHNRASFELVEKWLISAIVNATNIKYTYLIRCKNGPLLWTYLCGSFQVQNY